MAANGYIVVALIVVACRVMGGLEWKISKDWGGQVMDDYLSAIDAVPKKIT
jgi:hypothetical protein